MRRVSRFRAVAAGTITAGLASAVTAALGQQRWALVLLALTGVALALLLVLSDSRRKRDAKERQAGLTQIRRMARQTRRLEDKIDMTQRRVVAALETTRLEAADRARDRARGSE